MRPYQKFTGRTQRPRAATEVQRKQRVEQKSGDEMNTSRDQNRVMVKDRPNLPCAVACGACAKHKLRKRRALP